MQVEVEIRWRWRWRWRFKAEVEMEVEVQMQKESDVEVEVEVELEIKIEWKRRRRCKYRYRCKQKTKFTSSRKRQDILVECTGTTEVEFEVRQSAVWQSELPPAVEEQCCSWELKQMAIEAKQAKVVLVRETEECTNGGWEMTLVSGIMETINGEVVYIHNSKEFSLGKQCKTTTMC